MTTTRKPRNCRECGVRLTTRNRTEDVCGTIPGDFDDLCVECYELDNEDIPIDDEDWEQSRVVPTGRTNMSHAACTHPRTPAGRAACRAAHRA